MGGKCNHASDSVRTAVTLKQSNVFKHLYKFLSIFSFLFVIEFSDNCGDTLQRLLKAINDRKTSFPPFQIF